MAMVYGHDMGSDETVEVAAARREGVIEGLERAVELTEADPFNFFAVIKAEIERLRSE